MSQNEQELATAVTAQLVEADQKLIDLLGFEIEAVTPGRAVCHMKVREDMVNSHRYCQGGLIFALADHAFAYACMSRNQAGVTLSAQIMYTQAAQLGDTLTATAQVVTDGGRTATCDVEVTNQKDEIIARYQGVNYRVKTKVVG
ncbi:MAG: hydroxyphenylacetyl-CoA thioesterase PaaI [Chloroflexota bacterium]